MGSWARYYKQREARQGPGNEATPSKHQNMKIMIFMAILLNRHCTELPTAPLKIYVAFVSSTPCFRMLAHGERLVSFLMWAWHNQKRATTKGQRVTC